VTTTERKARAEVFLMLLKELAKERDPAKRLWRMYTLVFRTRGFQNWFREERCALQEMLDREEDADRARAMRRTLPYEPMGVARGKGRKSTLH
jgi:hypothetical protein